MSDDNLQQFQDRINNIEKDYRKKGRHRTGSNPKATARIAKKEAGAAKRGVDASGRVRRRKGKGRLKGLLKFAAFIYVMFLVLRIFISIKTGAAAYDEKVTALSQGSSVDQGAAMILKRGPVMAELEKIVGRVVTAEKVQPSE